LIAPYGGSDRALLADLALQGPFICIREPLFFHRDHPRRFVNVGLRNPTECLAWLTADGSGTSWHAWRMYREFFRMIAVRVEDRKEHLRCYGHLLRWLTVNNNIRNLIYEGLWILNPRITTALRAIKRSRFVKYFIAAGPQASDRRVVD
jgi:hypothetical protein